MQLDQLNRRELVTLLSAATLIWSRGVHAQPADQARRIGMLSPYSKDDPEDEHRREILREGLKQLGWIEGRNILIEYRWLGGNSARATVMAKELVELQPDLIVVVTTPPLIAVASETHTIPIVFVGVADPVGQGLVASLARPGGNATGFSSFEPTLAGKMLETLQEIAPAFTQVSLPFDPENPATQEFLSLLDAAAPRFSVVLVRKPVRNPGEIEVAIGEVARQPSSGLLLIPDPFTLFHRKLIVSLADRYRLPAIYPVRSFAVAGGLVSYGIDLFDLYSHAATYVDRILKGAKPADLPIQQPTTFELMINLKTAKALGLTVPHNLLVLADGVIE